MTSAEPSARRVCVVADLGDGSLVGDLDHLEDLLFTLADWAQDAARPGGDGWTPPGPLAGDAAQAAVDRVKRALRPTQTRTELDAAGRSRDVPPDGPALVRRRRLLRAGRAVAAELGRPGGDYEVRAAIDQHEDKLPATADTPGAAAPWPGRHRRLHPRPAGPGAHRGHRPAAGRPGRRRPGRRAGGAGP
jgi:hypothetical protein